MARALLMAFLLLTTPVLAGDMPHNPAHERLMAMSESDRKLYWTAFLRSSGEKCDYVDRLLFMGLHPNGTASWSVACRNGTALNVGIEADDMGSTKIVDCAMLKLVGVDCWTPFPEKTPKARKRKK